MISPLQICKIPDYKPAKTRTERRFKKLSHLHEGIERYQLAV